MMLTQTVLGLVLLGQASVVFTAPFLAMQGWLLASHEGE